MKRTCSYCETEFDAQRKDKNYCSPSCRQQAYMMRKVKTEYSETSTQNVNASSEEPSSLIGISKEASTDIFLEREYQPISSAFITRVVQMMEQRNYDYELRTTIRELPALVNTLDWINVRFRCLVEALLTLSERESVAIEDLYDISNAFTLMLESSHYDLLPENYPYRKTIQRLREKLHAACLQSGDNESTKFRIRKETRLELIVIRCELRTVARKRPFSQLEFIETKKQETCKTNHHPGKKEPLKQWQINYQKMKSKSQ
ncbi:MAG: hypothetical protein JST26_00225 [Bacteroidetes bacterium]|nr:hypothetical protein [Bacteroidota bacterium]